MKFTVDPVHTLLSADQPPRGAAVGIDTLRRTTVAATAMENGCKALWAVSTVEEANELAQSAGALRGGERGAVIAGSTYRSKLMLGPVPSGGEY